MILVEEIKNKVTNILSPARFKHSLGAASVAKEIAILFGANPIKAEIAGLLHDIAKELKADELLRLAKLYKVPLDNVLEKNPHLLHAEIGSIQAKIKFNIKDKQIISAIANHTLGKPDMPILDQILFIADAIEPNRPKDWSAPIKDVLEKTKKLEYAISKTCELTLIYLLEKKLLIHTRMIETYNFFS